jgi:hypothetical protein
MRRELFLHFSFWFSFFVFVAITKQYLALPYWGFWLGGIVGTILPDIDHVIYFYLVKPAELTSRRFNFLLERKAVGRMFSLLYETRSERTELIFHTIFFQLIFFVLTFWMLSSSGSLFGKGMALAFALHLLIDQVIDLTELGNFENWFKNLPVKLDLAQSKIYWMIITVLTLGMGLLM